MLASVPIFVRFPQLYVTLWLKKVISKAASLIGKLLYTDTATSREEIIEYARCFIGIDATDPFPKEVSLAISKGGGPQKCYYCVCFGHVQSQCPMYKYGEAKVPEAIKHKLSTDRINYQQIHQ